MILYFTGTGNSLSVARQLAAATGDTAVHIADLTKHGTCTLIRDRVIGFVFPVYFGDIPWPVQEFIRNTKFAPSAYIYAVATCGSTPGNALYNLQQLLAWHRCRLAYADSVSMIANSTSTWKKGVSYDYRRLDAAKDHVAAIAHAVMERRESLRHVKRSLAGSIMGLGVVRQVGSRRFTITANPDACVGCGLCVHICPVGNLTLKDGKVVVSDHCAMCMACVQWCPHGGIFVHGHAIARENQYHHPEVNAEDLYRR